MPDDLRAIQSRFLELMTAMARPDATSRWASPEDCKTPEGRIRHIEAALHARASRDPAAAPLTGWIAGGDDAFARARLDVYADGYYFRLADTLRDAYPKVAALAGDDFAILAAEYFGRHRPESLSLRYVGDRFAAFLAEHALAARFPYVADLARLEHARNDVFDQENTTPRELVDLAQIAPDAWAEQRFHAGPWVRVLRLGYPVEKVWRALEDEVEPPVIAPAKTAILVWRREFFVYHRPLAEIDAQALELLVRGAPFGEICELFAADSGIDAAAERAFGTLRQWLADGHVV